MCKYPMIETYIAYIRRGKQPSTVEQTKEKLIRIFTYLEENFDVSLYPYSIDGLDATVLVKWYDAISDRSTATINNYVCMLNPFLHWASTMDKDQVPYIYKDLSHVLNTRRIEKDKRDDGSKKYLTEEQVYALLQSTPGRNRIRDQAIIALFLGSGLRVSELCSLTVGSILDSPRGDIYVKRKGGEWKHTEVSDFVYGYIEKYLQTRDDIDDHLQPLFITTHGNPCNRNQIYKALAFKQKVLGAATGPHCLRHTFVSEVEKAGGASVARDLANHRSIIVTNGYDHTTHEQRQAAVNALPWSRKAT